MDSFKLKFPSFYFGNVDIRKDAWNNGVSDNLFRRLIISISCYLYSLTYSFRKV